LPGGTNGVAAHWMNNVTNPKGEKVTYHGVLIVSVKDRKVVHVQGFIFGMISSSDKTLWLCQNG
jgi:hypothetical protein